MAKASKKDKKGYKLPGIIKFIFLLVVILFIVFIYIKFSARATTAVVSHGTAENTVPAQGIAVYEEELISSKEKGVAIINYTDGSRVLSKTHVATIYSGNIDESKSNQIKQLNEKINYLETSMKNQHGNDKEAKSSEAVIYDKMKKISKYSVMGNLESTINETSELKTVITVGNNGNLNSRIEEFKQQRKDAERSISGEKTEYISKTAGQIYSTTDGYETIITTDTIKDINADVFKSLWNSKPLDYEKSSDIYVHGKIINNYEITVLCLIDSKNANGISENGTVYIRLNSMNDTKIPATVKKIDNERNKTLLVLNVTKETASFLTERKFEFELVKESYKGLSVPQKSVVQENGKSFVYVVKDGYVKKRTAEVLYTKDGVSIVKENNSDSENLLLYDMVIVESRNVSEGMLLGGY